MEGLELFGKGPLEVSACGCLWLYGMRRVRLHVSLNEIVTCHTMRVIAHNLRITRQLIVKCAGCTRWDACVYLHWNKATKELFSDLPKGWRLGVDAGMRRAPYCTRCVEECDRFAEDFRRRNP